MQVILGFVEPVFIGRLTNRPENVRSICISGNDDEEQIARL